MIIDVDVGYACYWLETDREGIVVKAPPIARWMIGLGVDRVRRWVEGRGGTVVVS